MFAILYIFISYRYIKENNAQYLFQAVTFEKIHFFLKLTNATLEKQLYYLFPGEFLLRSQACLHRALSVSPCSSSFYLRNRVKPHAVANGSDLGKNHQPTDF